LFFKIKLTGSREYLNNLNLSFNLPDIELTLNSI